MPLARFGASLSVLVAITLAAYPVLVYFTIDRFGAVAIAATLAVVCVARLAMLGWRGLSGAARHGVALMSLGGAALAAVAYWLDSGVAVLFYPVLVNAVLLTVFAHTLWRPPSMIERIARTSEPALSAAGVAYTRRVTIVWTIFFALNGAAALYTTLATPLETWALYNGFIAYLLIGALFIVEFAVRTALRARLAP